MTVKNGFGKCPLFALLAKGWKIKTGTPRFRNLVPRALIPGFGPTSKAREKGPGDEVVCFPAKENPSMEKALFDWPIILQYDVKAKYPLIARKFTRVFA